MCDLLLLLLLVRLLLLLWLVCLLLLLLLLLVVCLLMLMRIKLISTIEVCVTAKLTMGSPLSSFCVEFGCAESGGGVTDEQLFMLGGVVALGEPPGPQLTPPPTLC